MIPKKRWLDCKSAERSTVFPQNCILTAVLSTQTDTYRQETNYECEQIISLSFTTESDVILHIQTFIELDVTTCSVTIRCLFITTHHYCLISVNDTHCPHCPIYILYTYVLYLLVLIRKVEYDPIHLHKHCI